MSAAALLGPNLVTEVNTVACRRREIQTINASRCLPVRL